MKIYLPLFLLVFSINSNAQSIADLILNGNNDELAQRLAHNPDEADASINDHESPLHVAARCNNIAAARILLAYGARITCNEFGYSPGEIASHWGFLELANLLFGARIDQYAKDFLAQLAPQPLPVAPPERRPSRFQWYRANPANPEQRETPMRPNADDMFVQETGRPTSRPSRIQETGGFYCSQSRH